MKKNSLFLFFISLLFINSNFSQTNSLSFSVDIFVLNNDIGNMQDSSMTPPPAMDSLLLNDPALQNDPAVIEYKTNLLSSSNESTKTISINFILADTTNNVNKIHYKLGRVMGNNDIAEGIIDLNDLSQNNFAVSRLSNLITLNLGTLNNVSNVFGYFYIENIQGDISPLVNKEIHL